MPDHHGAPYSLTEDFVTVYRLHPLIPDDYRFVDHQTGELLGTPRLPRHPGRDGRRRDARVRPGEHAVLVRHRRTRARSRCTTTRGRCSKFERDGEIIDLSVVDLVRTRRRGVPRYNDFRDGPAQAAGARAGKSSATNQESVRRMREVYRSIDEVDTMVGLFAETPPAGFGFSDTAFRIFILMASRRLQSDRFLTVDFRPEIYSPFGMDWVAQQRHDQRHPAPLPGARGRAAARRQRVRAVAAGRRADAEARAAVEGSRRMTDQTRATRASTRCCERPLLSSIWRRRTHRVSRGSSIEAGSMSWTSDEPRDAAHRARGGDADRADRAAPA